MGDEIRPFKIRVSEADLEDLKKRQRATRWPDPQTVPDWSQGVPLDYVQKVCEYWARDYDWRKIEARLNALPQFRTDLDGLAIYFLHIRSPHSDAAPLILTHGWPGSVIEFLKVIPALTDPSRHMRILQGKLMDPVRADRPYQTIATDDIGAFVPWPSSAPPNSLEKSWRWRA